MNKRTDHLSSPVGWCSGTPREGSVGGPPPFSAGIHGLLWRRSWGADTSDISSPHLSTYPKPKGTARRGCSVVLLGNVCTKVSYSHKVDQITHWSRQDKTRHGWKGQQCGPLLLRSSCTANCVKQQNPKPESSHLRVSQKDLTFSIYCEQLDSWSRLEASCL